MSIFTKTTKGKVIALIIGLITLAAIVASIVLTLAGEAPAPMAVASMFFSIMSITYSAIAYLNEQEAEAAAETKAAARRAYWNNIAA